jgi:hypothetical protein
MALTQIVDNPMLLAPSNPGVFPSAKLLFVQTLLNSRVAFDQALLQKLLSCNYFAFEESQNLLLFKRKVQVVPALLSASFQIGALSFTVSHQ